MSTTQILLATFLGLIAYFFWRMKRRLSYWQERGIPCEEPSFIFGNLQGVRTKRGFTDIWIHHYNKFKSTGLPFSGFYWFQKPAVFVLDSKLVKNILIKDFNKFVNRGFYSNDEDDPLTGHLFLLDGQKWRNMRNKLSPTFTSGKMRMMFPTMLKTCEEFVKVIDENIKTDNVVDMKDFCGRFTMDVIGTAAFGIDCNSLRDPNAEFRYMGRKAFTDERHGNLGLAFLNSFPNLAKKLHMKAVPDYITEFFMRIVRENVEYREKHNIQRNDFMSLLIDMKNNKTLKTEDGQDFTSLTLEQMAAQAFVFLVAGFETSSTTMSFALYELAQHQDIQQKVRDNINEVMQKHNGEYTYQCMQEMQYLNQVVSETLRLYTVLPLLNRECVEEYVVQENPRIIIEKGTMVLIPGGAIHRDPAVYPNPEEFNPDNFLPEKVNERDSVEWLPFGEGPRNCIGMRFGLMQTRAGLAYLLKNFKFSVCDKTQIPMEFDKKQFLVATKSGIYLKVEKV